MGEDVYAIGNPLGELTFTFTGGYVSAKDRSVTMSDGTVMNMLQTDTAINSGNSGGPLFNEYGQVIGIVSAKLSSSSNSEASVEGLGFAIPINDVKDMVTSIIEHGYVTGKPNVGILMKDVPQEAQQYGVPAGSEVLAPAPARPDSRRAILSPLSTAPQCRAARPSKPPSRTVRRAIR